MKMSNLVELHQRKRIREEASVWVVRIEEGLSEEQEQEFSRWVNAHPDHQSALVEIATAWDELSVIHDHALRAGQVPEPQPSSNRKYAPLAIAAVLVVGLLVGWMQWGNRLVPEVAPVTRVVKAEQHKVYDTAVGEQSKATLVDGSKTQLNTNSRLVVDYSAEERTLELMRGEALFEVQPDANRPFVVAVGNVKVKAVGTAFNVFLRDNNQVEVVVTEGKVVILPRYEEPAPVAAGSKTRKTVQLSAGEMLKVEGSNEELSKVDGKRLENRLAWTSGMVVYDDQPLEQVLNELSRYTDTKILIGDPSLKEVHVAGYFKAGDVDALLFALSENFNISWSRPEDNLIVLNSK